MLLQFRFWMATAGCCIIVSWARLCSLPGEDCSHTACCTEAGHKCYKKDEFYAACRPSCEPGLRLLHGAAFLQDHNQWSCEVIDVSHPNCADDNGDCIHLGCCKTMGHKCFMKDPGEAFCKASSPPGWLGHEIRPQNPRGDAMQPQCADDNGDCVHLGCCKTRGHKCFMKNFREAFCKASSPAGWLGHEIRPQNPRGEALQPEQGNANEVQPEGGNGNEQPEEGNRNDEASGSRERNASQQEVRIGEGNKNTLQPVETEGEAQGSTPGSSDVGPSQQWNFGLTSAHYWDCQGQSCDATHLQPWDASRYVSPPEYAPINPEAHGGSNYGEKLWLTGAVSDAVSKLLGPDAHNCGSDTGGGGGCGKCLLIRNPDAEKDWTAVVMKKKRCHPWNAGCADGKFHLNIAVPGFDHLEMSAANICGNTGTTLSREQSSFCGGKEPRSCNCSVIPANSGAQSLMRAGCELFQSWGWRNNNPALEWRPVECPSNFIEQVQLGAAFGPQGPITISFDEVEVSSATQPMQPAGSEKSGLQRHLLDTHWLMLPSVGIAVASPLLLLLAAARWCKQSPKHGSQLLAE